MLHRVFLAINFPEDIKEKLGPIWGGSHGDDVLRQNQEALRQRLIRVGLASSYSDSHTEVFPNAKS